MLNTPGVAPAPIEVQELADELVTGGYRTVIQFPVVGTAFGDDLAGSTEPIYSITDRGRDTADAIQTDG